MGRGSRHRDKVLPLRTQKRKYHSVLFAREKTFNTRNVARSTPPCGYRGVVVLRDGSMLGGGSFFYFVGTYSCSGGIWKGELTRQEHTSVPFAVPIVPTAGRIVTAGFTRTNSHEGAGYEATALVGKRSLRYHANMRLL